MTCPSCNAKMLVKDSREDNKGRIRRYKCSECNSIIHTTEIEIPEVEYADRINAIMRSMYKRGGFYGR